MTAALAEHRQFLPFDPPLAEAERRGRDGSPRN